MAFARILDCCRRSNEAISAISRKASQGASVTRSRIRGATAWTKVSNAGFPSRPRITAYRTLGSTSVAKIESSPVFHSVSAVALTSCSAAAFESGRPSSIRR